MQPAFPSSTCLTSISFAFNLSVASPPLLSPKKTLLMSSLIDDRVFEYFPGLPYFINHETSRITNRWFDILVGKSVWPGFPLFCLFRILLLEKPLVLLLR